MRRLASLLLALGLVLATMTPVMAYVLYGWFSTSAIDTDSNAQADLSICYDQSTSGAIYINRSQLDQELERWHGAAVGAFSSNGVCNNDGSNIKIIRDDLGYCEPGDGLSDPLGLTQDLGNTGYTEIRVYLNTQCFDDFDWYDTDGIDAGKFSALAVALHEMGHALGLNHSAVDDAVMNAGGPDNCDIVGHDLTLAADDAAGYRVRYPGINDTATSHPASAGCVN